MTRISTERRERRFRRALLSTITVLAVLCAGFGVVAAFQGPRLSGSQIDEAAVVERAGQQLRIFANQAVAQVDAGQVVVEPVAPFSVATAGDVIAVTFAAPLRYGTTYTVRVSDVTSPYAGNRSELTASFTTPAAEVWWLDRGSPSDAIMRSTLGGVPEVVYTDQGIASFAVLKDALAVATIDDGITSSLAIVSLDGLYREEVRLPPDSALRGLAIDPGGTVLGFQLTARSGGDVRPDTLFMVDLEAGRTLSPVAGLDGEPLRALRWEFVPGGGILVLDTDGMLSFVGADGVVTPLGRHDELGALSPDGSRVVVGVAGETEVLTLADGSTEPLDVSLGAGTVPIPDSSHLRPDGSLALLAVVASAGIVTSSLQVVGTDGPREVFALTGGAVFDLRVSPNGQFAALAIVPDVANSSSDGYGAEAMSTTIETVVVDLDTGTEVLRQPGFALEW